jgi:hypothetical protein
MTNDFAFAAQELHHLLSRQNAALFVIGSDKE